MVVAVQVHVLDGTPRVRTADSHQDLPASASIKKKLLL